jgi:hypothetical protein
MPYIQMYWDGGITTVHLSYAKNSLAPFEEMVLEDTSMDLVQQVRREALEDIGMREIGPERSSNGVQPGLSELGSCGPKKYASMQIIHHATMVPCFSSLMVPAFVCWYVALKTATCFAACNETLFRIVGNICCQDRKAVSGKPVCTRHHHARLTGLLQRRKNMIHAEMKQVRRRVQMRSCLE